MAALLVGQSCRSRRPWKQFERDRQWAEHQTHRQHPKLSAIAGDSPLCFWPCSCLPWRNRSRPGCSEIKVLSTSSSRYWSARCSCWCLRRENTVESRLRRTGRVSRYLVEPRVRRLGWPSAPGRNTHACGQLFCVRLVQDLRIFAKQASGDAVFGAVCGYILLGIIWSLLYSAVETASPGSFDMPAPRGQNVVAAQPDRGVLSYYSFITLATVGYGDVTPTTPLARTLAWMEAITASVLPCDPGGRTRRVQSSTSPEKLIWRCRRSRRDPDPGDSVRLREHLRKVHERETADKHFTLVVVAEGAREKGGEFVTAAEQVSNREARLGGIAAVVAAELEKRTGKEARVASWGTYSGAGVLPISTVRLHHLRCRSRGTDCCS